MEFDRIDLAILDHLQRDGRATTLELSEKVGLSPSPCHRRQRLLEQGGVIRGYVALLDPEKVGLPVSVFVFVELASQTEETFAAFERAVATVPEIMECYVMSGTNDYLLRVVAADLQAYEAFLRATLMRFPGVRNIRSTFALRRVVYRTNLPVKATAPR